MSTVSVIILTHNEEQNIKECIESVQALNAEILVLDDHSTDQTIEIAQSMGAVVLNVPDNIVGFGEKRRYAVAHAKNDWVLHVDSDERLTKELCDSLLGIQSKLEEKDIVELPRLTYLLGKPVRHCGWYPDFKRRFYNRRHTDFNSSLVHEDVLVKKDSALKKLKVPLLHFSYPTLESLFRKQIFYAQLWGREKAKQGRTTSLIAIPLRAIFFFIKTYIIRKGFLDGKTGLWLSIANMNYECSKYLCLYAWQKKKQP